MSYLKSVFIKGIDYISGDSGIDASTEALETIEYEHHEIHAGSTFQASISSADLDTEAEINICFTTPDTTKWGHCTLEASNSSGGLIEILEGATVTADSGTDTPCLNVNRNSQTASVFSSIETAPQVGEFSYNATITGDGTVLDSVYLGAGKSKMAASSRSMNEWVLAQDTTYAFRLTGTADNGMATIRLRWYEHTDKN